MQLSPAQKSWALWSLIAALGLCFVWLLAPVLAPFVVAFVLAYALTPVVDALSKRCRGKVPRVLLVLLVELLFLLLASGILLMMVPILAKELPLMREQLPGVLDALSTAARPLLAQWGIHLTLDPLSMKAFAFKYLNANVEETLLSLLSSIKLGGSVAFALIGNLVLVPVVLFYLLLDWAHFSELVRTLIPPRLRGAVDGFVSEVNVVLGQYLRGQLLVMLILACYYSLGLTLFGLDLALPVGIFTGLAICVPYVGFGLGLLLATCAGLLQLSASQALLAVAVVYGCGQVIEGFFLTPRLVGERIGLHPLAVIFALLAFGQLLGFVGVLIALPASAVLLVAVRRTRSSYLASQLYRG